MPATVIATATWLADLVVILREEIQANITDPITRSGNSRFCLTAYPRRQVEYPVITIVDRGISNWKKYVKIDKEFLRPAEVYHLQADSTRARKELKWTPKVDFQEFQLNRFLNARVKYRLHQCALHHYFPPK